MEVVRVLPYVERNEVALHWVRLLRDKLEDAPQDETIRTALRTIDDVLTHAWQSPLPPDFYLKLCVASVTGAPSPDPKVPLLREAFAWEGIGGFVIRGTVGHDPDMWQPKIWKPVIAAAVRHVEQGKQFGLYSRNLLENHRLLDTYVSNADLVEWLKSPSEIILKLAAHTLARREAYQRLAEAASQAHLTASQEALVLKELAYSGGEEGSQTAREPATYQPSPELEFWKHCLSEEPLEAAAALWEGGSFGAQSRKPFSWWMHGRCAPLWRRKRLTEVPEPPRTLIWASRRPRSWPPRFIF